MLVGVHLAASEGFLTLEEASGFGASARPKGPATCEPEGQCRAWSLTQFGGLFCAGAAGEGGRPLQRREQ